ncbi:MAG: hypothetical protein WB660_13160 [Candidatus Sulfotelmatobacter sp.]
MRITAQLFVGIVLIYANAAASISKPHIITFGKWATVQWCHDSGPSTGDDKPLTMKIRPLLVDARAANLLSARYTKLPTARSWFGVPCASTTAFRRNPLRRRIGNGSAADGCSSTV